MNKIPEEYRKYFYLGLIAVAAVWVFCIAFVVAFKIQQSKTPPQPTDVISVATVASTESTSESTTESTTAAASSSEEQQTVSIDGNNMTTSGEYKNPSWVDVSISESESVSIVQSEKDASSEAAEATRVHAPSGKEAIVKAYVDGINNLKQAKNFKLTKSNTIDMSIDSITGGEYVRNIVQKYIDSGNVEPKTYKFVNGNDSLSGSSPNAEIAPASRAVSLSASDVKNASVKEGANGSFTITLEFGKDRQTLSEKPPVYSSCMDVLDMNALGLTSSMSVNTLNVDYNNGKIVAVFDSAGRIKSMTHTMDIEKAAGSGKITLISVSLEMHGKNKQTYEISYS